jgi:hypothetical protein
MHADRDHASSVRRTSRSFLVVLAVALGIVAVPSALGSHTPAPASVTIAGSLQSEIGCPGDWQPDCALTHLSYDAGDGVWQGAFAIPAGGWEYKAALNDTWDENYGANAAPNGPNIPLSLASGATVKFYYDHETHWVADNVGKVIATVPGSFQSELGCPGDWDPGCLRSWLQDPDGDGIYSFSTSTLPPGDYEAKVAHNEGWDENYGDGGVPNGPNIQFTVTTGCTATFTYDPATHILTITCGAEAEEPAVEGAGRFNTDGNGQVSFTVSNEAVSFNRVRGARFGFAGDVESVTGSGNAATLTGTGSWNGQTGYAFEVSVVDNATWGRLADTISVVIRDPSGAVVFTSFGPQVVKLGDIAVQATSEPEPRTVTVVFTVTVPATTDATGRSVYIAGTLDRLDGGHPAWDPGGVVLTRVDATHWAITLTGKEGTQIEYKYTLGSWEYIEKDAACGEIANRQLTLTYGTTGTMAVNDTVANWRNVAPCGA